MTGTMLQVTLFDRDAGTARRIRLTLEGLALLMKELPAGQAICFGALRDDLPDVVRIVPRSELDGTEHDAIAIPPEWEH